MGRLLILLIALNCSGAEIVFQWPKEQSSLPYPDRYSVRLYGSTNMETMAEMEARYFKWYGSPMGTFFVTFTERMTGGNTKPQDLRMLKVLVPVTKTNGWFFLGEVKYPKTNFVTHIPTMAVTGTYVDRWTN